MEVLINKECRACLSKASNMIRLETKHVLCDNKVMSILDLLQICTSIKVAINDGYPQSICQSCVKSAEKSYEFRIKCENSENTLKLRKQEIKELSLDKECDENKSNLIKIEEMSENNTMDGFDDTNDSNSSLDENSEIKFEQNTQHSKKNIEIFTNVHKIMYICKICEQEFNLLTELKEHLINNHKIENSSTLDGHLYYKCILCQKDYNSVYEYYQHFEVKKSKSKHFPGEKTRSFICTEPNCGKAFYISSHLSRHLKTHDPQWPQKCRFCDEIIQKMPDYKIHLNDKHEDKKKIPCNQCNKKFFTKRTLNSHLKTHSGERKYMCDVCGFSFNAKNNLITHRLLHGDVYAYKCKFCPKEFKTAANLRSHLFNHTDEKKYECNTCNRKFLRYNSLREHKKVHSEEKQYACNFCDARFRAASTRRQHLKTHTGERNHICDVCGKAFKRSHHLTTHKKIHTGETPHVCEICGKGFIQKHVLRSHLETHQKYGGQIPNRRKRTNTDNELDLERDVANL